MWLEALSGLKINLSKSALLPVGSVENPESLALELGCKIGSLPTTYLGLPLGAKHNSMKVWDGIEEKVSLMEETIHFKRGENHTHPNHPLQHVNLPYVPFPHAKGCHQEIRKFKRDFLWGGGNLERKLHLVKWKVMCLSKDKGGLGIRGLLNLNRALLGQWN